MYKNYFILNRFVVEAGNILNNYTLQTVFSQDKNKLIFEFTNFKESRFLEISTEPGFPFITLKNQFYRAKRNTINLFQQIYNQKQISFEIAESDRIVKINLTSASIYFTIRGKYTNVHLVDSNNLISSFKTKDEETEKLFLDEINKIKFINYFNLLPSLANINYNEPELIRKEFPIIGKEIVNEANLRFENNNENSYLEIILEILNEIRSNSPEIFIQGDPGDISLGITTFQSFPYTEKIKFDNLIDALNFYISKRYYIDDYLKKSRLIEKHLDRAIEKLALKLNNIKNQLERESKEEYYSKIGNLLLINIDKIKKGMQKIELDDIYSDEGKIEIKLNDTLTAKQNVDNYFKNSKREKITRERNFIIFKESQFEYEKLKNLKVKLGKSKKNDDLDELIKELKIKMNNNQPEQDDIKKKFKHYIIEDKFDVFVGKDSKNNDLLTVKFAKQNDYWFHARSLPGSHVVLRVDNSKEIVPKNILKAAASIAAFHSKAKTAGVVPVSYTLKKYVIKKKGMEPGKVALLKEDVLLVKPEIPQNCKYILNE